MKVKRCLYFWLLQVLQVIVSTLLHHYHYYHYYYCYYYYRRSCQLVGMIQNKIQKHFVCSLCVARTYALSQLNTLSFSQVIVFSGFLVVVFWMIYAQVIIELLIRSFLDPKVKIFKDWGISVVSSVCPRPQFLSLIFRGFPIPLPWKTCKKSCLFT